MFDSWFGKIPWRMKWQPTPVFLPRKSQGQRSLVGYSSQGCKESDMTEVTQHACTISIQEVELIWLCGYWSDFNKSEGPGAKGHHWNQTAACMLQVTLTTHPSAPEKPDFIPAPCSCCPLHPMPTPFSEVLGLIHHIYKCIYDLEKTTTIY